MSVFFFNLIEPVSIKDLKGCYKRANKAFRQAFGLTLEQIIGKNDSQIFTTEVAKKMVSGDNLAIKSKSSSKIYKKIAKNKNSIYTLHKIPLLKNDGSVYAIGTIFTNITKEEEVKRKLLLELNTDSLTGLKSKKYIIKKINQFIKNETDFSILHLDFNQFNLINDSLGHTVGDKVLKKIARMLKDFLEKMF
ncbi:diguanylate cyclase [Candidatus Gracilibacteria bacterium]|nr:diguanylate cyclase [Candidatus Gracilibacteria bacterium]